MKMTYKLAGLDCANCAAKMENAIQKLDGVTSVSIQFLTGKMKLDVEEGKAEEIIQAASKIIKKIEPSVVVKRESK